MKFVIKPALKILRFIWTHPANRKRRMLALYLSVKWQIRKRLFPKPHDYLQLDNFILRCYPDSASASLMIYCNSSPDYHEMNFMRRYLKNGDAFLDIGANIGVYSLLAASLVGKSGKIIAFEPGAKARQRLIENVELNNSKNIAVYDSAVGQFSGHVEFLVDCDTTNRIQTFSDMQKRSVNVPQIRLDDVVNFSTAMGKIDIEGAEPLALMGAERLLAESNPPVWLLELNGALKAFGHSEETFRAWLFQAGYDLCLYSADRLELNFSHSEPWLKSPNVLAVARSHRQLVSGRCGARLII